MSCYSQLKKYRIIIISLDTFLHCGDGDDVGEDDKEEDEVVVVAGVPVPVVDSAGRPSGLQSEPTFRRFS